MKKQISDLVLIIASLCLLCNCSSHLPIENKNITVPTIESPVRTDPWVLVDSKSEQLIVYRKGKPAAVFENLAFGAAGVKQKIKRGDDITPIGLYTVGWISMKSKFKHFIGLNYPSVADAERGLEKKIISRSTFNQIVNSHKEGLIPPQNTPLGGMLGIHGVGRGSLEIHNHINWTAGCIALENEQIEALANMIYPGIQIEIR